MEDSLNLQFYQEGQVYCIDAFNNSDLEWEQLTLEIQLNLLTQGFQTLETYTCNVDNDNKNLFFEDLAVLMWSRTK